MSTWQRKRELADIMNPEEGKGPMHHVSRETAKEVSHELYDAAAKQKAAEEAKADEDAE